MRILSIRGRNLASLAGDFEIALHEGPLAQASLFAIVGETGAGKSTILDALCLALYGRAPRLQTNDAGVETPDVGHRLSASDARTILRRGVAEGFAEVDFVGVDGAAYRARWSARRARDRASGALQKAARSLTRLEDGQILEDRAETVREAVALLSGLSYEQFCRTILLAQGGFDAFLSADEKERAALLEKITGSDIYRTLSQRAYEALQAAEQTRAQLETRRGEHVVLTDEARAALLAHIDACGAQQAAADAALAALEREWRQADALARAAQARAEAQAMLEAAQTAYDLGADDRALLARRATAENLRPAQIAIHNAAQARVDAQLTLARARGDHDAAIEDLAQAEHDLATAQKQLDAVRAEVARCEPLWRETERCDQALEMAARELADAQAKFEEKEKAKAAAAQAHEDALAELEQARRILMSAQQEGAAAAPWRIAAEREDELARDLNKRLEFFKRLRAEEEKANAAHEAFVRACADAAAAQEAVAASAPARAAMREALTAAETHCAQIDAQALERRQSAVADCVGLLSRLEGEAQNLARARAESDEAAREAADAAKARADAEREGHALKAQLTEAESAAHALRAPAARADAAASQQAAHLRQHLVDGEPCPVCGAREHPLTQDSALQEMARELRALAQAADRRVTHARDACEAMRATWRQHDQRHGAALAHQSAAQKRIKETDEAMQSLWRRLQAPADILDLAIAREEQLELAAFGQAFARRRAALDEQARALRAAQESREKARAAAAQAEQTERLAQSQLGAAQLAANDAAHFKQLAHQAIEETRERLASSHRELTPLLSALDLHAEDFDAAPQSFLETLAKGAELFRATFDALRAAQTTFDAAEQRARQCAEALKGADVGLREAAQALQARAQMHADHHSRRAALLGGELLETHRQRRLDEARAAEDALRKTQERHGLARATLAGAQEALRASDAQLATCAAQLQEREAQWTMALNAAGLAPDECAALLAQDRAETARLQQQADALENSLAQASAIAAARAHDLQTLLAADIPARALDLVETERAAAQTQAQERHIAYARAEDARARDDLAREKIGALAAKIAAAEAQTRLWRDMNAAIGSANGDKFVKFAQGQTLDLLVERANLHLEDLKPRYRLQRADGELGLWVIDHDNGDDARATRSLSGGERFLISLALALALSGLGGRQSFAETLFIDEGFGALDSESLDLALDALERLRAQGRMIGVVSHVDAMKERIRAQVRVERQGPGRSTVRIVCA